MYLIDIIDITDEDVEESLALDVSSAVEGSLRRKRQTPPLQSCRVRSLLVFASSRHDISMSQSPILYHSCDLAAVE